MKRNWFTGCLQNLNPQLDRYSSYIKLDLPMHLSTSDIKIEGVLCKETRHTWYMSRVYIPYLNVLGEMFRVASHTNNPCVIVKHSVFFPLRSFSWADFIITAAQSQRQRRVHVNSNFSMTWPLLSTVMLKWQWLGRFTLKQRRYRKGSCYKTQYSTFPRTPKAKQQSARCFGSLNITLHTFRLRRHAQKH